MPTPFDPGYYSSLELRSMGFKAVGDEVKIAKNCTLINLQNISIGSHVRIDGGTTIVAGDAGVDIGHYIHIGSGCYLSGGAGITLGNFANLSQRVHIYTATDDYSGGSFTNPTVPQQFKNTYAGPVTLGEHVIIGSGSVVLPNIDLPVGTSIGALSMVKQTTQPWSVYAGCPVRRIKDRTEVDPDGTVAATLLSDC